MPNISHICQIKRKVLNKLKKDSIDLSDHKVWVTWCYYFFYIFLCSISRDSYLGQDGCQNEPVILQVDFTLMKIEEPTTYIYLMLL